MFVHGYKIMTIKNKATGRVETIRSTYNYSAGSEKKEIAKIKKEWGTGDYKVLSIKLV